MSKPTQNTPDSQRDHSPDYDPSGRSFTAWIGGKSQLARQIIGLMPPHHCYCEVFAGAAWVLFKKTRAPVEIINDANGDLINLYRCIQHHLPEFSRQFDLLLISRDEYERQKQIDPSTLTDIQRAARFYYLLRLGYGGKIAGHHMALGPDRPPAVSMADIEADLSAQHERLANVMVENQSYSRILTRYDSPRTLFYIDPPYWGCEDYYGKNLFSRDDFGHLREQLRQLKGRFILSLNNLPEVREFFAEWPQIQTSARWSVGNGSAPAAAGHTLNELLILNFDPPT